MKKRRVIYRPYVLFAVITVATIAVLTGGSLLILGRLHRQAAHRTAARDELDRGRLITSSLAAQSIMDATSGSDREAWSAFSRQLHALAAIEAGLQYVSISHSNVVVFHEQIRDRATPAGGESTTPAPFSPEAIAMRPTMLQMADHTLPVVVFSADFQTAAGEPRHLEVGISRDSLSAREGLAEQAVSSMFKLSFIAICIAFGICTLLLGWAGRREWARIAQRRAEEHLAFSGVLANGIVHDFRNPMSSMRLDIQMLAREAAKGAGKDETRILRLAERVRTTMDRLDNVFQEFLYMSKPAQDKRTAINLHACVTDCVNMLHGRFEQSGIRVTVTIPPTLQVLVYEASLRRALVNVLINAGQVSEPHSELRVQAGPSGGRVELLVEDHGPGIAPEMRERLFEMFATARPGGTGLGLFLARAAIERSGGHIEVARTDSTGTTIRMLLPRAEAERTEEHDRHE